MFSFEEEIKRAANRRFVVSNSCILLHKPIFTEEEETFLRLVKDKYNYLARDEDGDLCLYELKPKKYVDCWNSPDGSFCEIIDYKYLNVNFKHIQWEDPEPCEFRKFL